MARSFPLASPAPAVPWGWSVTGTLCGLALAMVLFAPARWVAAAVSEASGGRVLLDAARGTVWNGSAQLVLTGGAGSRDAAALPSALSWQLRPTASGIRLALTAPCCTPQPLVLVLQPRWGGAALRVMDSGASHWPATLLAGLGTPWNTLQPEGQLQLATRGLQLQWTGQQLQVEGEAAVTAARMSSRLSTLRPLGSYRISLAGGASPTLQIQTLEGSLQVSGSGQWVGSRLRFTGEARAEPEREAALANLLNIIGRREGARSVITIG